MYGVTGTIVNSRIACGDLTFVGEAASHLLFNHFAIFPIHPQRKLQDENEVRQSKKYGII